MFYECDFYCEENSKLDEHVDEIFTDEEGVEDDLPLEELLAMEVDGANCQAGRKICVDAVLLIDSDSVDPVELALQDKRFLIFDDKESALLQLVEDRGKVENDGSVCPYSAGCASGGSK